MVENILKPKIANEGTAWVLVKTVKQFEYDQYWFTHPEGFVACSALEVTNGIIRTEFIPQYHLSISKCTLKKQGAIRCTSQEAKTILKDFGLSDALEDNHYLGISRHFWLPVDENMQGRECECKETEVQMTADQGDFIYSQG